jgi:hypothetical protein
MPNHGCGQPGCQICGPLAPPRGLSAGELETLTTALKRAMRAHVDLALQQVRRDLLDHQHLPDVATITGFRELRERIDETHRRAVDAQERVRRVEIALARPRGD